MHFLSEVRGEWPDIDLDLPSGDHREQVIQHLYKKYGAQCAAMTANVITYRGKSAAREVGKVLGFDRDTLSRLSALVSSWEWKGTTDTMEAQFRSAGLAPACHAGGRGFESCRSRKFPTGSRRSWHENCAS